MNFIQTLYFDESIEPLEHHFGWVAPEYHLMGWALSCLQLDEIYGCVDLYCNSRSANLLTNKIGLPYKKVKISLDSFSMPNKRLWALPKIATYMLQQEPFIHVDGDVFLFNKLPDTVVGKELIAQNLEESSIYHLAVQKQIVKHLIYIPQCVKDDFVVSQPLKTLNAGIIGGTNLDFICEFSNIATNYVWNNVERLHKINSDKFNVFFEQHLFYSLARQKDVTVSLLFEELIENNDYVGLGDFHEVPFKRNYLHLLGNYKRDEFTCMQMASKLRKLHPEYFYRIISLFRKSGLRHALSIYADKEFKSMNEFVEFNKRSKSTYSQWVDDGKGYNTKQYVPNSAAISDELSSVKVMIEEIDYSDYLYTKNQLLKDFNFFAQEIQKALKRFTVYSKGYLYGRDLEHQGWFSLLFSDDNKICNQRIVCCNEIMVVESTFNWAGVLNKFKRSGIRYYEGLQLKDGNFYSVVIPEFFGNGFSVYDLDDIEKLIMEKLENPISISDLIKKMKAYVEDDVLANHFDKYIDLIMVLIKQLVLRKAVKPAAKADTI